MKKTCNKCGIKQDISQFYWRNDIGSRRKECKTCWREHLQSPVGRQIKHKYKSSKKGWLTQMTYLERTKEKRKAADIKYRRSIKGQNVYLKRRFGITLDEYKRKLREQNGVCAICGNPETANSTSVMKEIKRLAVDHNRRTGQVRDLLCSRCNNGIGNFGEDVEHLASAIAYLEKHKKKTEEGSPLEAIAEAAG